MPFNNFDYILRHLFILTDFFFVEPAVGSGSWSGPGTSSLGFLFLTYEKKEAVGQVSVSQTAVWEPPASEWHGVRRPCGQTLGSGPGILHFMGTLDDPYILEFWDAWPT